MEWFTAPEYWMSRLVLQKALAVIYLVAFLGAALQFRALIGERGMLPVSRFVARVPFRQAPSVFHLHCSDRFFASWAWTGCAVSVALVAGLDGQLPLWGAMLLWLVPWIMYLSIVNVGQTWYSFGWESLLLETGFLRLPKPLHRVEVAANHVTQLVVPVLLFTPQPVATAAASLMILTQLWLILSGNFSWLNWITIVLALSALELPGTAPDVPGAPLWYEVVVLAVAALLVTLSYRPVRNMISRRQVMNRSFDPLHLVNTYGAFGSVSRVRYEVVVEGTADAVPREDSDWREYEFRGKPGDPRHWPRQFAPYHLRLDWMMWFAALSPAYAESWFGALVERLLENDRDTLRLLRRSPFPPDTPPRYVRARLFRYRFTTWRELRETGACWERTYVREFLPPTRLDSVVQRS
ncbi:lipase maturation factor family protein [Streptomyces phaeochromogenes]|uniref:lipase maturation factor family protein n=1 Tax=Streptomyces phaeochromogenes TaxID=1923 RepID=UPI0033FAAB43